jgi:hypothetical protein
VQSDNVPEP